MPRFKLAIEYAGTRYSGWQIQQNARTVQGEIDRAVRLVTGRQLFELYGAGRTDAGVHALEQVAHLQVDTTIAAGTLRQQLNHELPADINILRLDRAPPRFHARHDAVARAYLYQISRRRTAFAKPFVWWVKEELSVAAMRDAASRLVGMHDFAAFTADDPDEKSTQVRMERVQLAEYEALILIRMEGSHFIWRMVRRLVGVLVQVGLGRQDPSGMERLLRTTSGDVARHTAPASGLFLERVYYDRDVRADRLEPATPIRS